MDRSNKRSIIFGWIALGMLAIAIVLEALPFGAVLNFATDGNGAIRQTYSYFDFMPFGYANFAPLITAIFTVLLAATSFTLLLIKRGLPKLRLSLFIITAVTAVISVCPILYGLKYFTVTGGFITLLLVASAVFCFFTLELRKQTQNANETTLADN